MLKIPEVRSLIEVTGSFDIILTVYARTLEELHNVVIERIGKIEGIQTTETFVEMQRTDKEPSIYSSNQHKLHISLFDLSINKYNILFF